jgi:phosphate:Na+ symporter
LVTFSSLVNLFSIALFLPFLNIFSQFLEKFFKNTDVGSAAFINHASVEEPQTALDLFKRETNYFIYNSMLINLEQLEIESGWLKGDPEVIKMNERKKFALKTTQEKYEFLKLLQGELQTFYLLLRTKLIGVQLAELSQMASSARDSIHSVKSMKDIKRNIIDLSHSSKNIKFNLLTQRKNQTENLYKILNTFMANGDSTNSKNLREAYNDIQKNYNDTLTGFYTAAQTAAIDNMDMTTVISFNRELFSSNKAMIMAVKDFLLTEKQAEDFNEIPADTTKH